MHIQQIIRYGILQLDQLPDTNKHRFSYWKLQDSSLLYYLFTYILNHVMYINHGLLLASCVQVGNSDSIDQGRGQKYSPFIKQCGNRTPDYHKKIQQSTKFQNSKSQNNLYKQLWQTHKKMSSYFLSSKSSFSYKHTINLWWSFWHTFKSYKWILRNSSYLRKILLAKFDQETAISVSTSCDVLYSNIPLRCYQTYSNLKNHVWFNLH